MELRLFLLLTPILSLLLPSSSHTQELIARLPEAHIEQSQELECHALVVRRGNGRTSLYGGWSDHTDRAIYINSFKFWIYPKSDPNRFDPAIHLTPNKAGTRFDTNASTPAPTLLINVDPCNRTDDFPNCWNSEGSTDSNVDYTIGQPITWLDPRGERRTLIDVAINKYTYPNMAGVGNKQNVYHRLRTDFKAAQSTFCKLYLRPQVSPLVIDFARKGVLFSDEKKRVRFELTEDAAPTHWIANPEDVAFLALDRNQNGVIDNGQELFGDITISPNGERVSDGYEALSVYDDNKDKQINFRDQVFSKLLLWNDLNMNGVSEANELKPAYYKVIYMSLEHDGETYFKDENNNYAIGKSEVMGTRGRKGYMHDVWLSPFEEIFSKSLTGTAEPIPSKDSEEYSGIMSDLSLLLSEDGWEEDGVVYENGLMYLNRDESHQIESRVLSWKLIESSECSALLHYNSEWELMDKIVSCSN